MGKAPFVYWTILAKMEKATTQNWEICFPPTTWWGSLVSISGCKHSPLNMKNMPLTYGNVGIIWSSVQFHLYRITTDDWSLNLQRYVHLEEIHSKADICSSCIVYIHIYVYI